MTENPIPNWGPIGVISTLIAVISWFFGGICSLILAAASVFSGFIGVRKHQKLSLTGMLLGSFSLVFINLIGLGITPKDFKAGSNRSHIINSIKFSIQAYENLDSVTDNVEEKNKLIGHLKNALKQARLVNLSIIETQVNGFANHYTNEFINGTELLILGYNNADVSKKMRGAFLLDEWGKWYKKNRSNLKKIKEPSLSIVSLIRKLITH